MHPLRSAFHPLRVSLGASALALALSCGGSAFAADAPKMCPDEGADLTLPPGFCATIFADNIGHARQMAVAPDGTLYVNTWSGRYYHGAAPHAGGFIVALKDSKGDGKANVIERFGMTPKNGGHGGTGIGLYDGYVYAEETDRIDRYKLNGTAMVPTGARETVLTGMPLGGDHPMHPFIIGPNGALYVDMGSATNACQEENRQLESPGLSPCRELITRGGTWLFDANKLDQRFSPADRYATGIRNGEGFAFDTAGRLYVTQHGRDQLFQNWPKLYTEQEGAELPAEELLHLEKGGNYGWPECYYDQYKHKLMLAPEYGGNGRTIGVCADRIGPVAAFPGHWAPNGLAIDTTSAMFPKSYRDTAFIAFHGSWNRAPSPQGGYNIVAQPLRDGKAAGAWIVFADGFAGGDKQPGAAKHRPSGVAFAPDGALFVSDDIHGTIYRITYHGSADAPITAAPGSAAQKSAANDAVPPEGIHPDAGRVAEALPVPSGATKEDVALGAKIFNGQLKNGTCAGCHGVNGSGGSQGPNLTDSKWLWSDGSLSGIEHTIAVGVPHPKLYNQAMPAKGGVDLSPSEIKDVADYVWAISHP